MQIRPERKYDTDAVFQVNLAAFESPAEATLVDTLRATAAPIISLVAEDNGEVVGHILFSPVTLPNQGEHRIMGLELVPDTLVQLSGTIQYHDAFKNV